jgi:hypothetical protein
MKNIFVLYTPASNYEAVVNYKDAMVEKNKSAVFHINSL